MTNPVASTWAGYRGRILTDHRALIAHEIAHWSVGQPVESPNQDPCAAGHTLSVRNGWLVCARCGAVLGKA